METPVLRETTGAVGMSKILKVGKMISRLETLLANDEIDPASREFVKVLATVRAEGGELTDEQAEQLEQVYARHFES